MLIKLIEMIICIKQNLFSQFLDENLMKKFNKFENLGNDFLNEIQVEEAT